MRLGENHALRVWVHSQIFQPELQPRNLDEDSFISLGPRLLSPHNLKSKTCTRVLLKRFGAHLWQDG